MATDNQLLDIIIYKESFQYSNGRATVIADYIKDELVIRSTMLPTSTSIKLSISAYQNFVGNMKEFVTYQVFKATRRKLRN